MTPISRHNDQSTASWTNRLLDGLRRIGERRALREMLALRSDRLLADIGFSREALAAEIEAAVAAAQLRRRTERQIRRELHSYSDQQLSELGISRLDIRRIAREHAEQAVNAERNTRRFDTADAA